MTSVTFTLQCGLSRDIRKTSKLSYLQPAWRCHRRPPRLHVINNEWANRYGGCGRQKHYRICILILSPSSPLPSKMPLFKDISPQNTYPFICLISLLHNVVLTHLPIQDCLMPDSWYSITFTKVPRLPPFVLPVTATCRRRWVCSIGRMILTNEKGTCSEKNLPQCQLVHHKSNTDRPGIEPGPWWWKAGD